MSPVYHFHLMLLSFFLAPPSSYHRQLFKFIKSKVGEVQFLFITHRSDSYSVASSLVGVYKETVADTVCSRTLAIDLRNAAV